MPFYLEEDTFKGVRRIYKQLQFLVFEIWVFFNTTDLRCVKQFVMVLFAARRNNYSNIFKLSLLLSHQSAEIFKRDRNKITKVEKIVSKKFNSFNFCKVYESKLELHFCSLQLFEQTLCDMAGKCVKSF